MSGPELRAAINDAKSIIRDAPPHIAKRRTVQVLKTLVAYIDAAHPEPKPDKEGSDFMESMQAEIDELRAVLMPFALIAKRFGNISQTVLSPIFLNDCQSAKSALDRANLRNGMSQSEPSR